MTNDLYLDEAELSCAAHNIDRYTEFLCSSIEQLQSILSGAASNGAIQDQKICQRLNNFCSELNVCAQQVDTSRAAITGTLTKFLAEAEELDHFQYPGGISGPISSL